MGEHLFDAAKYETTRAFSSSGEARLFLHYGDLSDTSNLTNLVRTIQPDEIYNLGAQSHVEAMWLILQHDTPDDYVCATGQMHTVRHFVETAFKHIDMDISWRGSGDSEEGYDQHGALRVKVNPKYY